MRDKEKPDAGSVGSVTETGGTGFPACAHHPRDTELIIARRNLPHWRFERSVYFVTFRTKKGELAEPERTIILDALKFFHRRRYRVIASVAMPDHVHLLLQPMSDAEGRDISLSVIMQGIKGFTSREINKRRGLKGAFWQDESYDRIVRDEEELLET